MTKSNRDNRESIAIVGLGLIGASLALSLRRKYRIIGCETDEPTRAYALAHGVVDELRPLCDVAGVTAVIVCTPLSVLRETVTAAYDAVGESAVITDVGSVKGILKGLAGRIVGGHPMAGTEHSGIEAAKEHLFENATYCVVPYENSREEDVRFVSSLARAVRAKPLVLSPEAHDEAAANFSHMPHMVAYALMAAADDDTRMAGSGFIDSTRIAGSDPVFWTEVLRRNRANVLASLARYERELSTLHALLRQERYDELGAQLHAARKKRLALADTRQNTALSLTVDVRDEVGSIGAVTQLLRHHSVNIADIRILDSREGVGGVLQLRFETQHDAQAARAALTTAGYTFS